MNLKTENGKPQEVVEMAKPPVKLWVLWLVLVFVGTLYWFAFVKWEYLAELRGLGVAPWLGAAGMVIRQGVNLFSGEIPDLSWQAAHLWTLLSVLITLLIAPALFLLNLRQLILDRLRNSASAKRTITGFIVGGVLCSPIFGMAPFIAVRQVEVYQSMHRGQTSQANRDAVTADLHQLAYKARVFYFVPTNLGGGGHRWKNIQVVSGNTRDFSLDDLHYTGPILGKIWGDLMPQSPSKFILETTKDDTVLTISGIGKQMGNDVKFANKDSQVGRVQVTVTVTPHTQKTQEDN